MTTILKPVAESLFFSKHDPMDPRLGEWAKPVSNSQLSAFAPGWTLLGYPDDEGIRLNGGRPGARLAPDCIRNYLYRMTPPQSAQIGLYDLGNLQPGSESLAERHAAAQTYVHQALSAKMKLFTLGGGHDYGFPDAAAFVEYNLKNSSQPFFQRPLVLNFDAHLDVRSTEKGLHSGTPFFRLLEKYHAQIDFFEIGIQPQCNSVKHRSWAQDHHAVVMDLASVERVGLLKAIRENLGDKTNASSPARPVWISVDIDSFRNSEAPGCSQSFATGLQIKDFLPVLSHLREYFDVQGLGIYEVSPALDQDDRTSKLAALILFHALFHPAED